MISNHRSAIALRSLCAFSLRNWKHEFLKYFVPIPCSRVISIAHPVLTIPYVWRVTHDYINERLKQGLNFFLHSLVYPWATSNQRINGRTASYVRTPVTKVREWFAKSPSLVPRLSLLPRNNSTYDLWHGNGTVVRTYVVVPVPEYPQRSSADLLFGRSVLSFVSTCSYGGSSRH